MIPSLPVELREYLDRDGRSPFGRWFDELGPREAAKIAVALMRIEHGNLSRAKGVGGGVYEYRIDFGPGYRIYFALDGPVIVILLGAGTKQRQRNDIDMAKLRLADYRGRQREGS